ncbi:receptor-type tyrosine-protein phosphatase R, partial [Trichonephila clavata]
MIDDEAAADKSVGTNQINETPQPNKDKTASSLLIDRLIPESNKIVFSIQLRKPMTGLDVIEQLSEAVAEHANLDLDSIKVTKYEDPAYQNSYGKKISIQSIFSDKNWEAWQLAVVISATLFAMFFIFVIFMFVSSQRIPKNKVRPVEEPRHVIVQPILRPVVAGVGVIQPLPENREHHIAAIDTDSEHTPSPSRSPMRSGRGLLERRGSNASLTLDLNRSQENIHCGTPPKECSAEEFLQSASKRLTRRQLRSALKDVKALHTEFWEIPMNHPEKVEIAGSGTKNRYKTILPNENTRVHLYEKSEDPLSSYINANYVR